MSRLLSQPQELKVKTNVDGLPASFVRKGRAERITEVYQRWRVADLWWKGEVARDYFMIGTERDFICDIYRDMTTNTWYLSRIHD
jgi:hypothetical protein